MELISYNFSHKDDNVKIERCKSGSFFHVTLYKTEFEIDHKYEGVDKVDVVVKFGDEHFLNFRFSITGDLDWVVVHKSDFSFYVFEVNSDQLEKVN